MFSLCNRRLLIVSQLKIQTECVSCKLPSITLLDTKGCDALLIPICSASLSLFAAGQWAFSPSSFCKHIFFHRVYFYLFLLHSIVKHEPVAYSGCSGHPLGDACLLSVPSRGFLLFHSPSLEQWKGKKNNWNDLFRWDGPVTGQGEADEGCFGFVLSWEDAEALAKEQVKTWRHLRRLSLVF